MKIFNKNQPIINLFKPDFEEYLPNLKENKDIIKLLRETDSKQKELNDFDNEVNII